MNLKAIYQGVIRIHVSILKRFFVPPNLLWHRCNPLQIVVQEVAERVYRKHLNKNMAWQCFFVDLYMNYSPRILEERL